MAATYDPQTPAGKVRLLVNDTDTSDAIFDDGEIGVFLTMRDDDVFLAAATALRTIAGNEALVSKKIKLLDLSTDGPAVAKALRELAAEYEAKADADADLDWSPMVTSVFAYRERVVAERLKAL